MHDRQGDPFDLGLDRLTEGESKMSEIETRQLNAWRGEFGTHYIKRNPVEETAIRTRAQMWARILQPLESRPPKEILEVGANVGINLHALRRVCDARLCAVEPNDAARATVERSGLLTAGDIYKGIGQKLPLGDAAFDMVFTSGVLIHIAPNDLPATYDELHRVSRRFIVLVEYFADQPEEIGYRGEDNLLFKRDFGSDLLDRFPNLVCLDYGFFWKRTSGLGNLTWWLFEKP